MFGKWVADIFNWFSLIVGKKAVVKPGQAVNELVVRMAERAEENAQRKLRELMLPKRHKNLYRKMVHAQKTADKDMRQLAERRKSIEKLVFIMLTALTTQFSIGLFGLTYSLNNFPILIQKKQTSSLYLLSLINLFFHLHFRQQRPQRKAK